MSYAEIVVNSPLGARAQASTVAGDAAGLREPGPDAFTYAIPPQLAGSIALGQMVWVPFGARRLQGVVVALSDSSPVEETREIDAVVDPRPFLSAAHVDLARWMAATYLCSLNDAIQAMLPSGVEQEPEILIAPVPGAPTAALPPKQTALVELLEREGEIKLRALPRELRSAVEPLVRRGLAVKRIVVAPPRARPKHIKFVRLVSAEAVAGLSARSQPKAKSIVQLLQGEPGPVWVSAVYAGADCSLSDLRRLEKAGVVALEEEEVWRDSLATRTFDVVEPPELTPGQAQVWERVVAALRSRPAQERGIPDPAQERGIPDPAQERGIPDPAHERGPGAGRGACYLLHGVTGSGKTEIYLRALAETIRQGKQAIVLVPEISLTPQTIRRFGARFPTRMAVLHSRLSLGERYDTWRRCRDGQIDFVVGSRSALFAPLPDLGLIVMDEEHEPAYKQDSVPHYHAREVALQLAQRAGAVVILGSATPDLETYYRATRGEFGLLELPHRIMGHRGVIESEMAGLPERTSDVAAHWVQEALGAAGVAGEAARETSRWQAAAEGGQGKYRDALHRDLPPVEIVDLRAELKAGNRSIFSRALQREMARALAAHEQIILYLNRRGTATFILCRECGNVFKCRRCDNPMTLHVLTPVDRLDGRPGDGARPAGSAPAGPGASRPQTTDQLVCHHCNRREAVPTRCPHCGSARIRFFGVGTQKVEEELRTRFPQARTLRWDFDVTRGKESHEAILSRFVEHQADVLIGTQMIAKGLDLPLVTLVGVISADTSLNLPDFRAGERTFQLLTQVAGRAGRSILGGKVILQTYAPDHYAIQAASQHDYRGFYAREIAFRREQRYPPFDRLIRLLYSHTNEKRAAAETEQMARLLTTRIAQRGLPALDLIGPAPAFFRRVRGEYRYQLIVRGPDPHALLADVALPRGWRVDVDPVSVL